MTSLLKAALDRRRWEQHQALKRWAADQIAVSAEIQRQGV